jgi:hypothetical protein
MQAFIPLEKTTSAVDLKIKYARGLTHQQRSYAGIAIKNKCKNCKMTIAESSKYLILLVE